MNENWLNLSLQLKSEGIKNHEWMLRLDNKRLEGIDPYKVKQKEMQALIYNECLSNPLYFFREVFRLPDYGSKEGRIQSYLYRSNAAKIYCYLNGYNTIDMTSRQTCKSTVDLMILTYELLFGRCYNTTATVIANNRNHATGILDNIWKLIKLLPKYIINGVKFSKTKLENKFNLNAIEARYPQHENEIYYEALTIGLTSKTVYVDDMLMFPSFYILYDKLLPILKSNKGRFAATTIYKDSKFIESAWKKCKHWKDEYYDYTSEQLTLALYSPAISRFNNTVLIHYEPEELISISKIRDLWRTLFYDKEAFRNEMCIHPFDEEFDMDKWLIENKIEIKE